MGENGVKNPVEAEYWVDDHCGVIDALSTEAKKVSEERVRGIGVAETPVHG